MKQLIQKGLVGLGIIIIVVVVVLLVNLTFHVSAEPLLQTVLPHYGWSVCQDLGIAPPPGGGVGVQHMLMCRDGGWRVQVYCIEPGKPVPPLQTTCSMVNSTDFWCGDEVQLLRVQSILETPAATSTSTLTNTPTFTPTYTPTFTPTFTPTQTNTSLPSQTNTSTPSQTSRPSVTADVSTSVSRNTPQSTVYVRPHPGGPGNSQLVGSIVAIILGAMLVGITVLIRVKKTRFFRSLEVRSVLGRFSSWLLVAGLLLMLGGSFSLVSLLKSVWASISMDTEELPIALTPTRTPFQPQAKTPFRPQPPTSIPTYQSALITNLESISTSATPNAPKVLPTATTPSHFANRLLNFPQEKISLRIFPGQLVNAGKMIKMKFLPAPDCTFGTGRGCVSMHRNGQVILLTIHSGVGGEGEVFRKAIESTGLDQAGFSIGQIRTNLAAMQNVSVQMNLGSYDFGELELAALARVPAIDMQHYFDLPFDDALEMVAGKNKPVRAALDSGDSLLVFEICGWHVAGEAWGKGTTPTSASIYLGFIRLRHF